MINTLRRIMPAALILLLAACSEPDTVGIEVQPATDQVEVFFTDTITIEVNTLREDSLRSDEGVAIFNLAGSFADPVFGNTNATFYSQVRMPNNNSFFSFGTDPVLDSVVLTLAYADYYGDTLTPMNFEVYRLDENLVLDSTYHTNNEKSYSTQLFSGLVDIRPKQGVTVSGTVRDPHLRLTLDKSFFEDNFSGADDILNFIDNNVFTQFFKGIAVTATPVTAPGTGCIATFSLTATMSKLTFYYNNTTGSGLIANFEFNSESPRFTHFEHDYSTATFGNTFPISGSDKFYVQSTAGVKARIKFPHIRNLSSNGPVSINKAELVIPAEDNSLYKSHSSLLVFGVDAEGKEAIIPDLFESASYYGGVYSSTENNFKFNIGRYVQRLVSNQIETDYGISLISAGGAINAQRTVIPGPARTDNKVQLRITYSKLN